MKSKELEERLNRIHEKIYRLENDSILARRIEVRIPDYEHHLVCLGINIRLSKLIRLLLEALNLELVETPQSFKFEKVPGKNIKDK